MRTRASSDDFEHMTRKRRSKCARKCLSNSSVTKSVPSGSSAGGSGSHPSNLGSLGTRFPSSEARAIVLSESASGCHTRLDLNVATQAQPVGGAAVGV